MKKLIALCLGLLAFGGVAVGAQKLKPLKHKEKRFEPVVRQDARQYAGHYVGVEPSHMLDIEADSQGHLTIISHEDGRRATLREIKLSGSKLTATKVYDDDGETMRFEAEFVERVLNGERAFGLMVEGVSIKLVGATLTRIFYKRVPATDAR